MVRKWSIGFDFRVEILRNVPIWTKFERLPLNSWGDDFLSRIASVLGKPICADECASGQRRVSYARVLVEMDVTKELKKEVHVQRVSGEIFLQKVAYDWLPEFCFKCDCYGHDCSKVESGSEMDSK